MHSHENCFPTYRPGINSLQHFCFPLLTIDVQLINLSSYWGMRISKGHPEQAPNKGNLWLYMRISKECYMKHLTEVGSVNMVNGCPGTRFLVHICVQTQHF
uniref:Uncharacterized protein n=1 Tax=Rhizophora mucronata TaxID=61149 RepID=A0A2P2ISF9_RHIMU